MVLGSLLNWHDLLLFRLCSSQLGPNLLVAVAMVLPYDFPSLHENMLMPQDPC